MLILTLQFIRPLRRDRLIADIYRGLRPQGCLLLVEKVLGEDSLFNRLFIKYYYEMKRRNGYSDMEIAQKREALENVLIPVQAAREPRTAAAHWLPRRRRVLQVVQLLRNRGGQMIVAIGNFLFRYRNMLFPLGLCASVAARDQRCSMSRCWRRLSVRSLRAGQLLVAGFAIASDSLVALLCALPLVVFAYAAIVAAEEAVLTQQVWCVLRRVLP